MVNNSEIFRYPTALTIAGSDSGGGAGIQADLKTFSALGVYGASVITAVTAQNTYEVRGIQAISPEIVRLQLEAVFDDISVDAVKIGMLHNTDIIQAVADCIDRYDPPYVVLDPVMVSTSGSRLMKEDAVHAVKDILFGRVSLITPNLYEAEWLSGISIQSTDDMVRAGEKLLSQGCQAVLVKGGHLKGEMMTDILFSASREPVHLAMETIDTENSHGTGCTLSSAIAGYLALGHELYQAVALAKEYIINALREGADVRMGHGHGPVNHFFAPRPLYKINQSNRL